MPPRCWSSTLAGRGRGPANHDFYTVRAGRSGVVTSSHRRSRRRGALLVLCSLCLLLHPVVGNGPGPDSQTVYTGDPIDLETEAEAGELALHPAVNGDFIVTGAVRTATDGTTEAPAANVSGNLRSLTDARFHWDGDGGQYYRVNATVREGTYRLHAEPVPARAVAAALAVPADEARRPVARAARSGNNRAIVDEGRTTPVSDEPTLVATDDGYVFVTRALQPAPDRFRLVKLGGYALAGAGIVLGALLPVLARRRG
jgi:hypothetical protein